MYTIRQAFKVLISDKYVRTYFATYIHTVCIMYIRVRICMYVRMCVCVCVHGMVGHTYVSCLVQSTLCNLSVVSWWCDWLAYPFEYHTCVCSVVQRYCAVLCTSGKLLLNSQLNQLLCEHSLPCGHSYVGPADVHTTWMGFDSLTYALLLHINARKLGYRRCSKFTTAPTYVRM